MERAKVIIHMYTTLDGKIVEGLQGYPDNEDCAYAGELYDSLDFELGQAWGCGRATFETDCHPDLSKYSGQAADWSDKLVKGEEHYVISIDRKGKVFWPGNYHEYGGKKNRIVEAVTKQAKPEFISYLDEHDICHMTCGEKDFDFELFLEKLYSELGIKTFVLCGGAGINAEFLRRDLVAAIDLVVCPGIQGGRKELNFVGTDDVTGFPKYFNLEKAEALPHNVLHLTYTRK